MKFGLLVGRGIANKNSVDGYKNIGDYIQNIAAMQFLPRVDEYIDRENIDNGNDNIKVIMNGWFTGNLETFPCYQRILPLPISMHIVPALYNQIFDNKDIYDWFIKNQPIGCRDEETKTFLKSKNIDAYFSNCLTLTLGKSYNNCSKKQSPLVFVDPYLCKNIDLSKTDKIKFLFLLIKSPYTVIKIFKNFIGKTNVYCSWEMSRKAKFFTVLQFIYTYKQCFTYKQLRNAIFLSHIVRVGKNTELQTEESKLAYSDYLLRLYEKASLVVTSRIHCALPCLAMNTPVLFSIGQYLRGKATNEDAGRLGGVEELFNKIEINKSDVLNKIELPIVNKTDYKKYVELLSTKCENFIKES